MQTITIELTGKKSLKALQDLEHKHLIRIVKEADLHINSTNRLKTRLQNTTSLFFLKTKSL